MRAKGLEDGLYELGGQPVHVKDGSARLEDGTLAGSILKMDQAFRNVIEFTGCSIEDAVLMTSVNQAEEFGLNNKGALAVGKDADFVVMNEDLHVYDTVRLGIHMKEGSNEMNILVVKTPEELAEAGYKLIEEVVKTKENPTLGMATGSSPLGIYAEMRKNKLDTSRVTTVNLDEYVNLPHEDKNSYHYFMQEQLFDHLPFKQTYVPNGMASDLEEECKRYEGILAANPVDLQILGIGENGHIGFNEPGTPFNSPTNIVELTESTRQANLRFFEKEEDVPTHAITMGIGSIMKAKQILLVAMGSKKAEAVKELLQGAYSEACPATVLQRHPNVTVIADQEALSLCSEAIADEHRQVFTISNLLSDSRVGETAN